jgi:hypothetical protein
MTAKEVLKHMLKANEHMLNWYVSDLSDAELLVKPVPNANHIAWQLGHLISTEAKSMQPKIPGMSVIALPDGFDKQHSKEMSNSTTGFYTKAEYLALRKATRDALLAALDKFPDADLDKDPQMGWGDMVPTFASLFALAANHDMMHIGQFTVVRRLLGKPVLF